MKTINGAVLSVCLVIVAACGGGSSGGDLVAGGPNPGGGGTGGGGSLDGGISGSGLDGGISGSGRVVGTLDGFGSIILNDLELATGAASILIEGRPGLESDLRIGYVLDVGADLTAAVAESIFYRASVIGPIDSILVTDIDAAEATLVVLGQAVVVNGVTVFDGVSFDGIAPGDVVEISGSPDAGGQIVASYVGLRANGGDFKVIGMATMVQSDQFRLGALIVEVSGTDFQGFDGEVLSNGDPVEVRLDADDVITPDRVVADEVERLGEVTVNAGVEVELEGFIDRFVSGADFDVAGQPVATVPGTQFENGSAAELRANAKVEVSGIVNSAGVIEADTIEFESVRGVRVTGTIESIDSTARTVTVLGVPLAIRSETELEDDSDDEVEPFTFEALAVGDYVETRGLWDGAAVVLRELERDEPDTDARLRGPVMRIDLDASEIDILSTTVRIGPATEFENDDDDDIGRDGFLGALRLGDFVDAKWDPFLGLAGFVDELSREEDDDDDD